MTESSQTLQQTYIPPAVVGTSSNHNEDQPPAEKQQPQPQPPQSELLGPDEEQWPPPQQLPQQEQLPPCSEPAPQNVASVAQQPDVTVTKNLVFKESPVTFTDEDGNKVKTVLKYKVGVLTWILAGAIFFGCFFCACGPLCFFIPCLMNGTKDVYHINPNDGSVVGVYRRIGC